MLILSPPLVDDHVALGKLLDVIDSVPGAAEMRTGAHGM